MCGRFVLGSDGATLARHYGLPAMPAFDGGYNIAPSQWLPLVRRTQDGGRDATLCRWGFIPHWAKAPGTRPINARAETLAEKPTFRAAYRRRRCLTPANGYYEWRRENGRKQPYFIRLAEVELFSFAGLWSAGRPGRDGDPAGCAIITTAAAPALAALHERMPVILEPGDYDAWLDTGDPGLLAPYTGALRAYPVSDRVNNPRHQGAGLVQPLG